MRWQYVCGVKHSRAFLFGMLTLFDAVGIAQDTVLVRQHAFAYPVRSVAVDAAGTVWISTGRGRERWNGVQFEVVDPFDFGGVAVLDGEAVAVDTFLESCGHSPHVEFGNWRNHVPGKRTDLSAGRDSTGLWWVCNGSTLFNFDVGKRPARELAGKSTRGLYFDGDRLVASTYDGLYIDGRRVCEELPFADGNILRRGDSLLVFGMGLASVQVPSEQCRVLRPSGPTETFQVGLWWKGALLVGGKRGLGTWGSGGIESLVAGIDVRHLVDAGPVVYVLTLDQGVFRWDGERLEATGISGDIQCADMVRWKAESWVLATDHGLGFWDERENTIEFLTVADGLGSNAVCNVHVDRFETVWCSTYNGIHRWNPMTGQFEAFHMGVEFNRGSFAVGPDGALWFGSVDGVFSVFPRPLNGNSAAVALQGGSGARAVGAGVVLLALGVGIWAWRRSRRQRAAWERERIDRDRQILLLQIEGVVLKGLAGASVASVAASLGMSERHLYRKAKDLGLKAGDVIRDVKLDYAQQRLELGIRHVDVAREVGYTSDYLKKLMAVRTGA